MNSPKKFNSHEEIEITFLKSDESFSWPEPEDDKTEQTTDLANNSGSTTANNCSSCNSLDVNFDNNSVLSELSSVSSLDGPIEDIYCKRRHGSSRYRINNRTRIEPSILNHFLDFLSTCFWKCSSGCQQLPDKQY